MSQIALLQRKVEALTPAEAASAVEIVTAAVNVVEELEARDPKTLESCVNGAFKSGMSVVISAVPSGQSNRQFRQIRRSAACCTI